ncbi:MAG: hypothetical protein LQ338_007875 [Usnochroma carphineum]|nr:MAG: hypothetical protein LQ338_007875 [Usnochroma carphineum]
MAQNNRIEKVAIVGATGRIGSHFAKALLKTGKHTVTALVRPNTNPDELPPGITTAPVNYDDPSSIGSALRGHHFLIISLSVTAPADLHSKIVYAAVEAGVPYIMPNVYGSDIANASLVADEAFVADCVGRCQEVERLGAKYVAMVCGCWYEWSLALGEPWFGFDILGRRVTFFDEGTTKVCCSTWEQCGRGVVGLVSLPVVDGGEGGVGLERWANRPFYISSFRVSQRDMLDSLHRVLGTRDRDWEIRFQGTKERREEGGEELKRGVRTGFAKMMYARAFYPDGGGDFEGKVVNGLLGLPEESLDEATRRAVGMVESGWSPFG